MRKSELRQIIKEEVRSLLNEASGISIPNEHIDKIIKAIKTASPYLKNIKAVDQDIEFGSQSRPSQEIGKPLEQYRIIKFEDKQPNLFDYDVMSFDLYIQADIRFWDHADYKTTILNANIQNLKVNNKKSRKKNLLQISYVPEVPGLKQWKPGPPRVFGNNIDNEIKSLKS